MNVAKRLDSIGEYYFSQKLREIDTLNKQGRDIINLGIGSPDLPPHPEVIKILHTESFKTNTHAYQNYKGSPILRNAISEWYKNFYSVDLNPDTEILPLIGSKEGIMHICMTYLNEGDCVLVPDPGYPTYSSAAKLAGAAVVTYHLKEEYNWQPDFEELQQIINAQCKDQYLMFINYPNMPTGQLPDVAVFERLIDFAITNNILLIHDNPYSFILNDKPMSILTVPRAKECTIELNSLSKSHNMAGWRVGMLCAAKERVEEILRFKSNMDSGMFLPVQLAAAKALSLSQDWHDEVNLIYQSRRNKVFELLDLIKCTYSKNQAGMFVWAKTPAGAGDGCQLSDSVLYNSNVFITPGGIFGKEGAPFIRISLCSSIEKIEQAAYRVQMNS